MGRPWTSIIYPRATNRVKELKKIDSPVTEKIYKKNVRRSLRNLSALEKKLKNVGIDLKFKPVDVPKL